MLRELRIGVTGHRVPPKLPGSAIAPLRATVARVLEIIAHAGQPEASGSGPATRPDGLQTVIVSSVAEGADQLVAEEGLAQGSALDTVIPFRGDDYKRDFVDPATKDRFDRLLACARTNITLDFGRDVETLAYEAAGKAMLDNSDILIAIWDENRADGRGGTAHVVDDALLAGLPVVLINPQTPTDTAILWRGFQPDLGGEPPTASDMPKFPENRLPEVVRAILPPSGAAGGP